MKNSSNPFSSERDYITFGSLLSQIRLSSVTFVRPTQGVETFGNISSPLCTLTIIWPPCKILLRSSQGNPSIGGVKRNMGSKTERCHVRICHLLMRFLLSNLAHRQTEKHILLLNSPFGSKNKIMKPCIIPDVLSSSWSEIMTTRCLAVTGGGSVGKCGRLTF